VPTGKPNRACSPGFPSLSRDVPLHCTDKKSCKYGIRDRVVCTTTSFYGELVPMHARTQGKAGQGQASHRTAPLRTARTHART
jgi:hypothetical protein